MLRLTSGFNLKWSNAAASAGSLTLLLPIKQGFRSPAALQALEAHIDAEERGQEKPRLVLYNYPSLAGAFAALFAHLYHSALNLSCLVLPFSSVEPLRCFHLPIFPLPPFVGIFFCSKYMTLSLVLDGRVADFRFIGIQTCYMLDFIGPKNFSGELAKIIPRVIAFDHRLCTLSRIANMANRPSNLELRIDTRKNSARASFHYFSEKFSEDKSSIRGHESLLKLEEQARVEKMISYMEDADLRRWELAGIKEFGIGIRETRTKLNTLTNPHVFEQLLELDADDLIAKGNSYIASRLDAANNLLARPFKIRLGRGLYGECLAIRADGNAELSHEIAMELSSRSAAAGLRPIGAVIFMQRGNLKMCLRTNDSSTDTSEIAKAFGGGGKPGSSSFIIRMDEYNEWTKVNSHC